MYGSVAQYLEHKAALEMSQIAQNKYRRKSPQRVNNRLKKSRARDVQDVSSQQQEVTLDLKLDTTQ